MRHLNSIFAASLLTLATGGIAAAAEATTALHVRSGPSTGYPVVDTLYAGETVNVEQCSGGWCQITHSGPDGWASASYLAGIGDGSGGRSGPPPRQYPRQQPNVSLSFNVPGFGFWVGNGGRFPHRPGRHEGYVCFYRDFNYQGGRFCVRPGQHDARLGPRWNDQISSIRISGDVQVQVCEDFNYGGRCAVLDKSRRALTGRNNDIISSYRVR